MASICRSAAAGGASRSVALLRSAPRLGRFASSPGVSSSSLLRKYTNTMNSNYQSLNARSIVSCSALGSVVELSLMPLHSAEASARLRCLIAVNSSSWNWLTQGQALPL
ncbi:hypothetical protein LUZ63_015524 [Rhynchospora breviuscula]|uniref:Uncharacterized protein n=1 Tax=Rhynchospora breviuscula TaxID=2022672 RepID=A0A9Q0CD58_9POAL|nr:hypothetical protein LUZ63_015524 [Rhynchospora breviuscula]